VRLWLAAPGVLAVAGEDPEPQHWPVAEVSLSPRLGSTPRLLRRPGHGQIECEDSPLLDRWLPRRSSRIEQWADWLERRRAAIAVAAVGTVAATVLFIQSGLPALAEVVAGRVPVAVERHVSDQVVAMLDRVHLGETRIGRSRRDALQRRFRALVAGEPRAAQMRMQVVHAPALGPNAFALPDGRIFITDALVELARDDEELLAVLAHEAGHHVHRHGMRQALESSSVFVVAGVLLGDVSGTSLAVSIPAVLLSNGFSRGHEREADAYALDLLERRGISPLAFARILGRLAEQGGDADGAGVVGYLSTHPPNPERIAAAEAAAL
jgi:Zn-dependent protease with chaperone function